MIFKKKIGREFFLYTFQKIGLKKKKFISIKLKIYHNFLYIFIISTLKKFIICIL